MIAPISGPVIRPASSLAPRSRRTLRPRESVVPRAPSPPARPVVRPPPAAVVALAALAGALAAIAPLSGLDTESRAWALALTASSSPSTRVIVVEMTPKELRQGACDRALPDVVQSSGALGALLPPALDMLCDVKEGSGLLPLPAGALRLGPEGQVFGFDVSAPEVAGARALGLPTARWIAGRAPGSVPVVELAAITSGRVAPSVLAGRVVVASLAVPGAGVPFERRVADVVAGALDGGVRRETPRWLGALLPALATLGAFFVRDRHGGRIAALVPASAVFVAIGMHLVLARTGAGLSPLASVLAAITLALAGLLLAALQNWRAIALRTGDILQPAGDAAPRRPTTPEGSALWSAVKQLAADSFPADAVLVAEHDAATSALRFHDVPREGEIIAEAGRDSRRPPYRGDDGIPVTRVVRGFVHGRDVPSLLVPLVAHGELQGYVVLVGDAAAELHLEDPTRARVLGDELGLLVHHARKGGDRASPIPSQRRPPKLAQIAGSARAVAEHAYFFREMAHALPIGVAWADEAGRVRVVNRRLAAVLAARGQKLPDATGEGLLGAGALMLGDLLALLMADDRDVDVVRAMRGQGLTATTWLGDPAVPCRLHAVATRRRGSGQTAIAGYLVTLVPEGDEALLGRDSALPSLPEGAAPRPPLDTLPSPA